MSRRWLIPLLLVAACSRGGGDDDETARREGLEPMFPPAVQQGTGPSNAGDGTATGGTRSDGTPIPEDATRDTSARGEIQTTSATVSDPAGDATVSIDPAPKYADLVAATLTRSASGFELRIRLGGQAAPTKAQDADHTMNIASFYDMDGDGTIDFEVWANLNSNGWAGSYFDNRDRRAFIGPKAGVTWTPEGDAIVMRFPLTHLDNAQRFRWSVASEWGTYVALATPATARDDMPDNDAPVGFPG